MLPAVWLAVRKEQRLVGLCFVLACMIMYRLQIELMYHIGYPRGLLEILPMHVRGRGIIIYVFIYVAFMVAMKFSKTEKVSVFIAASTALFFMAFFVSSLVMIL